MKQKAETIKDINKFCYELWKSPILKEHKVKTQTEKMYLTIMRLLINNF